MLCPLFLLGVNQHVARDRNAAHRRVLLQTVAHMNTLALRVGSGGRLALIGDMHAALEERRWGYSLHSKTREADRLILEWAQQCGLKESRTYSGMQGGTSMGISSGPPGLLTLSTLEHITARVQVRPATIMFRLRTELLRRCRMRNPAIP